MYVSASSFVRCISIISISIAMVDAILRRPVMLIWEYLSFLDKQTSADDEEGRVALTSAAPFTDNERDGHGVEGGHGSIALLDTEIPSSTARRTKKKTCCMCCGMECVGLRASSMG